MKKTLRHLPKETAETINKEELEYLICEPVRCCMQRCSPGRACWGVGRHANDAFAEIDRVRCTSLG